jgi:hypothetical protein
MKFSEYILEGRVDDFKTKYGKKFSPQNLDKISKTITPKYLDWVGKVFDEINFDNTFPLLVSSLNRFDNISTNLPLTDINQYKSFDELVNGIKNYDNRTRRDVTDVKGVNVVFNDDKYFIVNPENYESSCYYGRGTKWCTAAETDSHFRRYNEDGKLFYIIDKTKPSNDPLYKMALIKKFDGDMTFFDSVDNRINFEDVVGKGKFDEIIETVNKFLQDKYPEQLKIYSDKVAADNEKKRIERLRIQRELEEKNREAQERREEGLWSVSFENMYDEGLKAHALLSWLDRYGDVEVRDADDVSNILRLEVEIDRLDQEYDNSEDPRPELLDQKSELEDELEELKNKIDVYNIVPTGSFYELDEFEVIADGFQNQRYAVGDEYDMERSAYEYVDNLIDDIGFEGFNKSFLSDYLDTDEIKNYSEEFFDYDVRESPESYFDDEDRELSSKQEETIKILKSRITMAESNVEFLEGKMNGEDDESIQDKIDSLMEVIDEYTQEIEDIMLEPDGDFPEDLIEDKVNELVNDAMRDPQDFLDTYGLETERFIDRREFIKGVIEEDGYGHTLNSYDGSADEIKVGDKWFYVMRID